MAPPRWRAPLAAIGLALALTTPRAAVAKAAGGKKPPKGKDAEGWSEKRNEKGGIMQELKIQAPVITEEDQYGYSMPEKYKCDSCKAVMFHLDQDLRKKQPKGRKLKEWEYTDVIDETCRSSFQGYGVKFIDGENALSGPGIEHTSITPGSGAIQMGGDSWNRRLGEVCRKIVYERLGEEEFYGHFYGAFSEEKVGASGRPRIETLCSKELRDCSAGPKPPPKAADEEELVKAKPKPKASRDKAPKAPKSDAAGSTAATSAATATSAGGGGMDVRSFLQGLAARHGLPDDEYTADRSERDWERLMVSIAGRVFTRVADNCGAEGSCPASR